MRNQPLPWESVPGPHYSACDVLKRKGWVQTGGWLLVVVLLAAGVATRRWIALVFGVLYALALVMEKSVAVTQRGLEVFHNMHVTTNHELWAWEDLYALTHEPDPQNAARTVLYFTKGDRTRHFSFTREDAENILRLAKQRCPGVKLYDGGAMRAKASQSKAKTKK